MNIEKLLQDIQAAKRQIEEYTALKDALQAEIIEYMTASGVDTLTAGSYKAAYKEVTSNRLDSKALKTAMPDIYAAFTKEAHTMRFTVS